MNPKIILPFKRKQATCVVLCALVLPVISGCDPAMTVYQVRLPAPSVAPPSVTLKVKTTRQLIGESLYEPEVSVTNFSTSELAVTGIDLIAQKETYKDESHLSETYPIVIPSGGIAVFHPLFSLNHGLQTTFSKAGELRLNYRIGNHDETIMTRLVSGPRDYPLK